MPYQTQPYVLRIVGNSTTGWRRAVEMTVRDASNHAGLYGIAPASRNTPRSSRSWPQGGYIEFRYIDPRPGAPRCITPAAQED